MPVVVQQRAHREVVSFVRRSARMRASQRAAWENYRSAYLLEVDRAELSTSVHPNARLDLPAAFGREAPLIVEIGPGTGESLVPMAQARPEANVLAFEVYQPAVAQILGQLGRGAVPNVRVVEADAMAGLRYLIAPAGIAELWTFFPDPWRKVRHHKRRLVDADFAALAVARLSPGARWRLATDWLDYAEQMRSVLDTQPGLVNEFPAGAPRWDARPVTRFEHRGREAGRPVVDLCYRRV